MFFINETATPPVVDGFLFKVKSSGSHGGRRGGRTSRFSYSFGDITDYFYSDINCGGSGCHCNDFFHQNCLEYLSKTQEEKSHARKKTKELAREIEKHKLMKAYDRILVKKKTTVTSILFISKKKVLCSCGKMNQL